MAGSNQALLDEVKDLWFPARKTRPIWVRRLDEEEAVQTLEGEEIVPAGNYLCRGEGGDTWPQSAERLTAKYLVTDEVDDQGWHKCVPRPEDAGVMAVQVPHPFQVQAKWGVLSGKAGDFVVKHYEDRDLEDPSDLWIADQEIFRTTYERVNP